MKKRFTLIELLVIIAILAILAGMLLPAMLQAEMVEKTRILNDRYGTVCTKQEIINIYNGKNEDGSAIESELMANQRKDELQQIVDGRKNLKDSVYFSHWLTREKTSAIADEKETAQKIDSDGKTYSKAYESWKRQSRENSLSYDKFQVLYSKNLIKEYEYNNWRRITGNKENLTEDQYNALKEAGMVNLED